MYINICICIKVLLFSCLSPGAVMSSFTYSLFHVICVHVFVHMYVCVRVRVCVCVLSEYQCHLEFYVRYMHDTTAVLGNGAETGPGISF